MIEIHIVDKSFLPLVARQAVVTYVIDQQNMFLSDMHCPDDEQPAFDSGNKTNNSSTDL